MHNSNIRLTSRTRGAARLQVIEAPSGPPDRGATMTRNRLARIAAVGVLTSVLVAGGAATSFAADTPQPTATATAEGHPHACARAQHADKRVQRALDRIQADATHKGSVAWLRARAAEADQAGKTDRATALRARADQEGRSMQEVARTAIAQYVSDRPQRLLDAIQRVRSEDSELLERLSK